VNRLKCLVAGASLTLGTSALAHSEHHLGSEKRFQGTTYTPWVTKYAYSIGAGGISMKVCWNEREKRDQYQYIEKFEHFTYNAQTGVHGEPHWRYEVPSVGWTDVTPEIDVRYLC
jgi:hypothetical protein